MAKFSDVFGLPKDRVKLLAGVGNFEIFKVEIIKSKKLYDVKEETEQGTKISRKLIDIAYFDTHPCDDDQKPTKEVVKYFAPNAPIVSGCKDMLEKYGHKSKEGILSEPVYIEEVKAKAGDAKNEYLFFV